MKIKKYHNVGIVPKYNRNIVETEVKSIPLTHLYKGIIAVTILQLILRLLM